MNDKDLLARIEQLETTLQTLQTGNIYLIDELLQYKAALNRIAMLGMSDMAYTKEFTNEVNSIARGVLSANNETKKP